MEITKRAASLIEKRTSFGAKLAQLPQEWIQQFELMRSCKTIDQLISNHGLPSHMNKSEAMEIWHYPFGIAHGALHSVHVAVMPDYPPQIYMHTEPAQGTTTPHAQPSWCFWKRRSK